ncbi:MAG: hypothetical protein ABWX67_15195 [Allosphingosinicella sp.]
MAKSEPRPAVFGASGPVRVTLRVPGRAAIGPRLDPRAAMRFAAAGMHSKQPVSLAGMNAADTSFPGFAAMLESLWP